jgi:vacuolar-type H+-ATPase subunit I/STV1
MRSEGALTVAYTVGKFLVFVSLIWQFWHSYANEDWKTVFLIAGIVFLMSMFEAAQMIVQAIERAADKINRKW